MKTPQERIEESQKIFNARNRGFEMALMDGRDITIAIYDVGRAILDKLDEIKNLPIKSEIKR